MSSERLTQNFVLLRALRWLPVGFVLPFLVLTPQGRGLSLGEIGVVFAVHSAVAIALEVPSGVLADALGRRRVMLAGAALTAVSLLVFALAHDLAAFAAALGLLATGRALVSGALEAWYVDSLRLLDPLAPLGRGLSRGTAAEALAMALGSLLAGAMVAILGTGTDPEALVTGYGAAAVAGALAALAYLAAVAALVREESTADERIGHTIAVRTRAVLAGARYEARHTPTVRLVLAIAAALGIGLSAVELLWQPRLAELLGAGGASGLGFGALAAAGMGAVAVGAFLSPGLARLAGRRPAYLAALAATALCVGALGLPAVAVAFVGVYLLVYLGLGLLDPIHNELLNDAVGSRARATMISADSLALQGGGLVANLGLGALAAAQGVGVAWLLAGLAIGLTAIAVARPLLQAGPRPA